MKGQDIHRKGCILVSDDLLLKKSVITKQQFVKFMNILKKIYIRQRDIDKILKKIDSW